jgi:hypothetical protein
LKFVIAQRIGRLRAIVEECFQQHVNATGRENDV